MPDRPKICTECAHARDKFGESCFCVLYGIIIGYSKTECRGFEREQIRSGQNGD